MFGKRQRGCPLHLDVRLIHAIFVIIGSVAAGRAGAIASCRATFALIASCFLKLADSYFCYIPNDSENRKYINLQTYIDWADVEFKREEKKYYLDKCNKKDTPFPALERTFTILQKASLQLKLFKDYSFYSSAIDYYNHVISSITAFKEKETNRFFYFTMNATTDKREYIRIDSYL